MVQGQWEVRREPRLAARQRVAIRHTWYNVDIRARSSVHTNTQPPVTPTIPCRHCIW